MQNAEWAAMFRQVPEALHAQLMLVLANRAEIAVENICRLDPNFIAFRGRMGGTTDTGLFFMLPYDQLSGVYLSRVLTDEEIQAILTTPNASAEQRVPSAQGNTERPSPSHDGTPKQVVPSFGRAPDATSVARNNLLERLRAARAAASPPAK